MTLGTSLFWITILVLVVLGIRHITNKKKWLFVAKIVGYLILLSVLIGLIAWGWISYTERPLPVSTLGVLSLGMSPLEVTLAAGKPDNEIVPGEIDGSRRYNYNDSFDNLEYFVRFSTINKNPNEQVEVICTRNNTHEVFGFSKYSREEEVKKKLGEPTSQSIRQDGLAKMISYEKWNVAFEIEKKSVIAICISSSGKVDYLKEYDMKGITWEPEFTPR